MPTYDYRCASCKKTYELRESFSAPMEHTCEECGKGVAKRLLSAPRIVFKGSGWYATDSRGKSTATSDNESAPSSAADSSESGSKSESSAAKTARPSKSSESSGPSPSTSSSSSEAASAAS